MKTFAKLILGSTAMLLAAMQPAAAADYAVILKTLSNPYWVAMKDGIQAEAQKKGVQVDVFAATSEDDITGQQRLLEDAVNKHYKAIGLAPITAVNMIQQIVAANQKGIYVVNIDEKIDQAQLKSAGGSVVAFLATDNKAVGEKAGKFILSKLGAAGGKVAIIEGKAGNTSGDARRDGAAMAFKSASNVKVVASLPADWDRARALDVATNMLQRNPDLKGIYACNDTMALGAFQAVRNAGKQGQIVVVGTDGAPEAIDSVNSGELTATVAQDSAGMGARALDLMISTLAAKPAIKADNAPKFIPVDSRLVAKGM
jgi:D-allose transport system substrate-binding protein